ncbi:uncharacterized protein LOC110721249 [Chenopodium quinoa]|uniref:uncharacterized protein LOC110721249 n=1 Tax=Chenopodium quinoa TaxID=63459 RepID=UPI000B7989FE|nr:uncharacterized protein LOC110721249 [Chenopodium quinoa]
MPGDDETPPPPPPPKNTPFHPIYAINNIKSVMNVTLDHEDSQYATWVELFQIQACACNVLDHIDTKVTRPTYIDDDTWKRLDAIVKQWIYSTISKDLVNTIMKAGATAQELWTRLEELFHDNKHTRAVYLEEQFSNTKLEHYTNMSDYCKQIKILADQLANVDCPVSDRKMVMQLIAGLTEGEYDTVAAIVSQSEPTPSFNKARSMFLLEETRKNTQREQGQAFVAQNSQAQTGTTTGATQPPPADQQRGTSKGRGRGRGSSKQSKGRGRGRANNNNNQQQAQQAPQWGRPNRPNRHLNGIRPLNGEPNHPGNSNPGSGPHHPAHFQRPSNSQVEGPVLRFWAALPNRPTMQAQASLLTVHLCHLRIWGKHIVP